MNVLRESSWRDTENFDSLICCQSNKAFCKNFLAAGKEVTER